MTDDQVELAWPDQLRQVLGRAAIVQDLAVESHGLDAHRPGLDGDVHFTVDGTPHRLLVECKSSGQPRHLRAAMAQLAPQVARASGVVRGLVVAPFISPASREMLAESQMGWLDLAGNARVVFPRLHLEIEKTNKDPFATKREQRSLFFPKSARLLKLLLHKPHAPWKVVDLASQGDVSVGQVSNVRRALIEKEWATAEPGEGFRLVQPDALLDAWRDEGLHRPNVALRGHTVKHGRALEVAIEDVFAEVAKHEASLLLASHSVARRVAPFARVAGEFFYASEIAIRLLKCQLDIAPTNKGENVTIYLPSDDGLWKEMMPVPPKLAGTGPIQTYLDLLTTGERGREAAERWRAQVITPLLASRA